MNKRYLPFLIPASASPLMLCASPQASAQTADAPTVITVQPLFEYPEAPADIEGLADKSAWLMQHFWDQLDVKKKSVDQSALSHAFSVYCAPLRFAPRETAIASVDNLLKRLRKNPALLYQFTRAAEENLYGPKAEIWVDEIYERFLRAAIANKKIPAIRKVRWSEQLSQLENCRTGSRMPAFRLIDRTGSEGVFSPGAHHTIIEFGDPGCDDCRMSRLKMESDAALQSAVRSGKAAIYFIVTGDDDSWVLETVDYPRSWTVAAAPDADDELDLRRTPSFYVLAPDGTVTAKNVSVDEAVAIVKSAISRQ